MKAACWFSCFMGSVEHNLNVSLEDHNKLVKYLAANKDEIWVAPLVEVAGSMKGD